MDKKLVLKTMVIRVTMAQHVQLSNGLYCKVVFCPSLILISLILIKNNERVIIKIKISRDRDY